jgi:hypothetical protein
MGKRFLDLGYIPTVQDYLRNMNLQPWMGGSMKTPSVFRFQDSEGNLLPDRPQTHEYCDGHSLPQPAFAPATDNIAATTNKIPRVMYSPEGTPANPYDSDTIKSMITC